MFGFHLKFNVNPREYRLLRVIVTALCNQAFNGLPCMINPSVCGKSLAKPMPKLLLDVLYSGLSLSDVALKSTVLCIMSADALAIELNVREIAAEDFLEFLQRQFTAMEWIRFWPAGIVAIYIGR